MMVSPDNNTQGDKPQTPTEKREQAIRALFDDPYMKAMAKRVHKKTESMPAQFRRIKKFENPARPTEGGVAAPPQVNKSLAETPSVQPQKIFKATPDATAGEKVIGNKTERRLPSVMQKTQPLGQSNIAQPLQTGQQTRIPTRRVPNLPAPNASPVNQAQPIVPTPSPRSATRKIVVQVSDGQMLDEIVDHLVKNDPVAPSNPNLPLMPEKPDAPDRGVGRRRLMVIPPESLESALAELDGDGIYVNEQQASKPQNTYDKEVVWVLDALSSTIQEAPGSIEKAFRKHGKQQEELPDKQQEKIPQDIDEYAEKIGTSATNLYHAMTEENLYSMEQLRKSFSEMSVLAGTGMAGEFDMFVKTLVDSYRDRKNEEALLGLIGVSAATGTQHLGTAYARLLTELMSPTVGCFFLRNTHNQNYNSFSLGNMIQEQLLELDEISRVSYLENLLTLLKERDNLIVESQKIIEASLKNSYFFSLFEDRQNFFSLLQQYWSDLALFRLSLLRHDELPEDICLMICRDIYEFLPFISGFPKDLIQRNSKVIYMLQKLAEENPLLFDHST